MQQGEKMSDCHSATPVILPALGSFQVIASLFIMGLAGSFTHCIGMCGPIAMSQMSMRLMNLSAEQMQQWHKVRAALALPYYFGKTFSYILLTLSMALLAQQLHDIPFAKSLTSIILFTVAFGFIYAAIFQAIPKLPVRLTKLSWLDSYTKMIANRALQPFGYRGLLLGMVLGLIPCGLVYSAIITALTLSPNLWMACVAMFAFGIATTPGLFMVAYLGQHFLARSRNFFRMLYALIMMANAVLLIHYATKLWL